ncbi:MAG: hypothetical protein MZW92_34635 [Comamonadaceae bacterium]|nr:hypothetical protein [Comamonadaceae bacterium]
MPRRAPALRPRAAAAAGGAGGRRDRARRQLGPERLRAADHAASWRGCRCINFADVTGCGTNTEVSLPCMFAPGGPARLRRGRASAAANRCCTCWRAPACGVTLARQPVGLQGRVRRAAAATTRRPAARPACAQSGRCLDEGLLQGLDGAGCSRRPGHAAAGAAHAGQPRPVVLPPLPGRPSRASSPACDDDDLRAVQPRGRSSTPTTTRCSTPTTCWPR